MTVELIYDADCPNMAQARTILARALAASGWDARWTEWDRNAADSPPYVRGYGSPTVLVNGQDVAGVASSDGGSCCRLYRNGEGQFDGAPSVEQIAAALRRDAARGKEGASPLSGWKSSLATLPAFVAVLLPAGLCPACWPAYAGILSSLGLGLLIDAKFLFPLTAVLLALAVFALGYRANRRRGYGPLILGLSGAAAVLSFKFAVDWSILVYAGLAVLVAASIWNAWPIRETGVRCPACSSDARATVSA